MRNALKEAAKTGLKGGSSTDDVLRSIDAMVARMRGVKRKLEACAEEEVRIFHQVDARTAHLAELAGMQTLDDVAYEAWSRRRLDRLLVDYLLRQGYGASASALVAAADEEDAEQRTPTDHKSGTSSGRLRDLVDIDTFASMAQIRQRLLRDHSVTEALAWCVDNKKELRKMDSKLEFMLRFQQFIELVRTQDPERLTEAIAHGRRFLSPLLAVYPEECLQASALMCYPPAEAPEEYAPLWSDDRWTMLADLFTSTHNQLLSLPSVPLLHLALSSGLSALKTPACHASRTGSVIAAYTSSSAAANPSSTTPAGTGAATNGTTLANGHAQNSMVRTNGTATATAIIAAATSTTRTAAANATSAPSTLPTATSVASTQVGASVCPICSPELNALARHVPYAHHSKSHVEHDLMLLPNGRVYGRARLDDYSRKSGLAVGMVRDLRTGDVYSVDELKRVYIT